MPIPLIWTDPIDILLRRLRASGASWDEIATAMNRGRTAVISRGYRIGAKAPPRDVALAPLSGRPDPASAPLPAGHAISWGAMTAGTLLEGADYVPPEETSRRAA